ncbi:Laccase domain protein YfiH [Chlamydiales bacterium SCGC AG-110-M15]|nr:Laccase domain protein YfiH [Chlamydiales bacterium SCGC AG-110-M15]
MIIKEQDGVQWIEYELLNDIPGLRHGTFLRHGGTSLKPYDRLNLAYGLGDADANVRSNLLKVQSLMNCSHLTWANQVHGFGLHYLTHKSPQIVDDCDGFLSDVPGCASLIKHADCQAALFYDPIHHAYANVHAGWRGSVQNIYAKTIDDMRKRFETKPEDLLVCISPSLGPGFAEFRDYKNELPEEFWDFQVKANYFDFWEISHQQLKTLGVLEQHMEFSKVCTYDSADDYFSYRRDKITGRQGTIFMLETG